ncbi:hypothetical protein [Paludibacterium denitrificans]|uniref:Uncharacterized protein n=1 Tax=Paludibacterium denitrificans TaxID=2675226 RepID=A0A844GEH5_9NEIS|nr:hypothetical protein [Paludibacterium denitrificans]MTD33720.1 hypothetical protein [Paludibacterium denitrificans]
MYPSHFSGENLGFNEFSPSTKERLINLYWMQLVNKKNSKLRDEDYYDTNREHYIIEYLKAINYTQDHIRRDADHLTEKHYIDWIIDLDFRQHEFIINKLDSLNNLKKYAKYNNISCIGSGKTLITTIFDILQNNTTTRNNTIPIVIKSWDETIMHDRIFTGLKQIQMRESYAH